MLKLVIVVNKSISLYIKSSFTLECTCVLRKSSFILVSSQIGVLHVLPRSFEKDVYNFSKHTHIIYKVEFSKIIQGKLHKEGSVKKQDKFSMKVSSLIL